MSSSLQQSMAADDELFAKRFNTALGIISILSVAVILVGLATLLLS